MGFYIEWVLSSNSFFICKSKIEWNGIVQLQAITNETSSQVLLVLQLSLFVLCCAPKLKFLEEIQL